MDHRTHHPACSAYLSTSPDRRLPLTETDKVEYAEIDCATICCTSKTSSLECGSLGTCPCGNLGRSTKFSRDLVGPTRSSPRSHTRYKDRYLSLYLVQRPSINLPHHGDFISLSNRTSSHLNHEIFSPKVPSKSNQPQIPNGSIHSYINVRRPPPSLKRKEMALRPASYTITHVSTRTRCRVTQPISLLASLGPLVRVSCSNVPEAVTVELYRSDCTSVILIRNSSLTIPGRSDLGSRDLAVPGTVVDEMGGSERHCRFSTRLVWCTERFVFFGDTDSTQGPQ